MKRIFRIISIFQLLFFTLSSFALEFEIDGLKYTTLNNASVSVRISGGNFSNEIRIPEVIVYNNKEYIIKALDAFFHELYESTNEDIRELFIPKTVERISPSYYGYFHGLSNLTEIIVDEENSAFLSQDGVLYYKDMSSLLCYPKGNTRKTYIIPDGVEEIYDYAFHGSEYLESIDMPNTLKYIQFSAFDGCDNLKEITNWSSSLEILGTDAFQDTKLSSAILSPKFKSIGDDAFVNHDGWGGTMTIYCQGSTPASILRYKGNEQPFSEETLENGILFVPRGSLRNYERAECWRNFRIIEEYDLPVSISLNDSSLELLIGETFQLNPIIEPEYFASEIVWKSSNPQVATVKNGLITAKKIGETEISVAIGEIVAKCIVTVADPIIKAENISLNFEKAEIIIGESLQMEAIVSPETTTDKSIMWLSSNTDIATVSTTGLISTKSIGTTIIIAICGDITASCEIKVIPKKTSSIALNLESAQLKVGETLALEATVLPEDATDKNVTWSSSNEAVATVDVEGKVTAVSLGEATITATCGEISATCKISVVPTPVESIALNLEAAQLKVGETLALEATVLPEDATDKSVTWSSSDETIATVDAKGKVTAVSLGEAVITATCGEVSAICKITVIPTFVGSLTLDPTEWAGFEGESFQISVSISPEDATNKSLIWSSSNEEIATVNEEGLVRVLKEGSCTITVETTDGSDLSATCIITSTSGIDEIFADVERFDIYNIQGSIIVLNGERENLKKLTPGIYILRKGSRVRKIFIR